MFKRAPRPTGYAHVTGLVTLRMSVSSHEVCHGAGTGERCDQMSAEIAKTLGHPSAAHALGSTIPKHSSTVSASGTPNAEASSPGTHLLCSDDVLGF